MDKYPSWLTNAIKYIGVKEVVGPKHNNLILRWWDEAKMSWVKDDETPWCAAFVGAMLEEDGKKSTRSGLARSYENYGKKLDRPAVGAIVVFWRGSPKSGSGHVGFVVGKDKDGNIMVLGGNQANGVNIKPFDKTRILGYRWPGTWPYEERFNLPIIASDGKLSDNEA